MFVEARDRGHKARVFYNLSHARKVVRPRVGPDRVVVHFPNKRVVLTGLEAEKALAYVQGERVDREEERPGFPERRVTVLSPNGKHRATMLGTSAAALAGFLTKLARSNGGSVEVEGLSVRPAREDPDGPPAWYSHGG